MNHVADELLNLMSRRAAAARREARGRFRYGPISNTAPHADRRAGRASCRTDRAGDGWRWALRVGAAAGGFPFFPTACTMLWARTKASLRFILRASMVQLLVHLGRCATGMHHLQSHERRAFAGPAPQSDATSNLPPLKAVSISLVLRAALPPWIKSW